MNLILGTGPLGMAVMRELVAREEPVKMISFSGTAAVPKGKDCTVMGNPDKKHTYTFIDDFGKALVVLSQHEDAFGEVWHVPNAETVASFRNGLG
ncbi:hypothetical protein [Paenibacillus wynnii]|uniref:hypothetical protein n=1 Tax=Paenibacillus wynnii TaxID=268407 RepID=UPI002794346B|nr:hypothetical protein [Paenibacillus wynnii]MDQ0196849.1 nucleoside-diphosphate-sugar epimerase [Paenibacillus wynnii]